MKPSRAVILLKSRGKLDLLDPRPDAWTDEDLAIGLSRTYRWGGYSAWDLPLSVAQHSLAVLALREMEGPLTPAQALRELLHDATEALFGGFDPISPIKPHLGEAFRQLDQRLQAAVDERYKLPPWTEDSFARHKHADKLAAANEACHVIGWSPLEIVSSLEITLRPLDTDPLPVPTGMRPWEPWPPKLAATLFLDRLSALLGTVDRNEILSNMVQAFSRLPESRQRRTRYPPTGESCAETLVFVEAHDGSWSVEGIVVDGERNQDGSFEFDAEFIVFTTDNNPGGELIRCYGWNCNVEIL